MKICEDSEILYNIFSDEEKVTIPITITIDNLLQEIEFHQMMSQQTLVPRLIAIQGEMVNGLSPLYRHPADEQPILKPFTQTTKLILDRLNKMLNLNMNHVLIQFYRNGEDNIGEHSDKTLDILKLSPIVNYTVGETRTLRLRNKNTKQKEYIKLKDNSLFILGPETNKKWLHGIKSNSLIKDSRISFTFRTIATFIDESGIITGQGAPVNSNQTNIDIYKDIYKDIDIDDSLDMLKAFSRENKESNFNWTEHYGNGFRALNFKFMDN
jgi:alkylated DNA repair dioxygenase AlkB